MATPAEIQAQLERGWSVFLDMKGRDLDKAKSGCGCCGNSLTQCLFLINTGLQWRVDQGVYDDTTDKLYTDMMEIIGVGGVVYGPTVDAGVPQVIEQPNDSVILNGTVTAGDNPIDQVMWIQVSGPSLSNIIDPTSESTQVDGLVAGSYVFKLTAIDTVGKIASDTTVVTVEAADMVAYFWNQSDGSIPSPAFIRSQPSVTFVSGSPIVIPFNDDGVPMYSGVAYASIESVKPVWADVSEFWNNGVVGEAGGLFGAYTASDGLRITVTQYPTQFSNSIRFQ